MSYLRKAAILLFLVLVAGVVTGVSAQGLSISIRVLGTAPERLLIEVSGPPSSSWSFPDSYAGVLGMANRVEKFQLLDPQGREISVRQIAPGQFSSSVP